ncbi:MAG: hypothetical protein OXC83_09375 [Chloroflexi bacterium]|nr:hypothetical protein [Chloroflexota bacterium]
MNISSYNITDVSYHYIGLRVLGNLTAEAGRTVQVKEISRNVLKFVTDRALRLMLPQPSGTFAGTGQKICQELMHFNFARPAGRGYELTENGRSILGLLNSQEFKSLRLLMAGIHIETYENLRRIVERHIQSGPVWRPVVEAARMSDVKYIEKSFLPTFGSRAKSEATRVLSEHRGLSRGRLQDVMHELIIGEILPDQRIKVANFRAICDRLVSLRLLNQRRLTSDGCEFTVSYSPCTYLPTDRTWYVPLEVSLGNGGVFRLFYCEPDMDDHQQQDILLDTIDRAFFELIAEGGYYDLPDLRDWVCQELMIPDAAFDDGVNHLLDRYPPVLSVGLHYDRVTAMRRPLVRRRRSVEIHNLIRRL